MRFPCMVDHDRMSLYEEAVYSLQLQQGNRGKVPAQEDPMDIDPYPPIPQGQPPQRQTSQQPQGGFGSFSTAGPSIQNPIDPLTSPGQQFQPSTVFRPSVSSTTVDFPTNNFSSRPGHMATDGPPQPTASESQGMKRKSSAFEEPSQPPSKIPRYLGK